MLEKIVERINRLRKVHEGAGVLQGVLADVEQKVREHWLDFLRTLLQTLILEARKEIRERLQRAKENPAEGELLLEAIKEANEVNVYVPEEKLVSADAAAKEFFSISGSIFDSVDAFEEPELLKHSSAYTIFLQKLRGAEWNKVVIGVGSEYVEMFDDDPVTQHILAEAIRRAFGVRVL